MNQMAKSTCLRAVFAASLILFWIGPSTAYASSYEEAVSRWSSYEDVGKWLNSNFSFDRSRLGSVQKRIRTQGPKGLLARNPSATYDDKAGYCVDSANLALDALNRIDPSYKARWIFVRNGTGKIHHWATGFTVEGKLHVMDFGAGPHWSEMKGIHGPYESLDEYANFLSSLNLQGFSVGEVVWRNQFPGQED
ncbi:transglutaminase-like domain-containing protein [Candidatus Reidiella endopervernicosa]|nr:transglutaminase-like domain-containing protein [Candidatus Reidiella endopervernicosa]